MWFLVLFCFPPYPISTRKLRAIFVVYDSFDAVWGTDDPPGVKIKANMIFGGHFPPKPPKFGVGEVGISHYEKVEGKSAITLNRLTNLHGIFRKYSAPEVT